MNQLPTQQRLGQSVAMTSSDGGFAVTPQTLSDIVEFAKFMCQSNAGIPHYLRNNAPDCAAITMQALKWGFDPFSVAQKSYKVKDVLAYEAQLIAAVVNARSGIKGRLRYHFDGEGNDLTCTVTGVLDGEECVYTSPTVGSITTKNSPLWKSDPQQQLGYFAARSWARRHCPEVILGVYDRDEAEEFRGPDRAKDITDRVIVDPLSDDPIAQPQKPQGEHVGVSASSYQDEPHDALTGEIITASTDPDESPSSVDAGVPSPAPAETGDYSSSSPVSTSLDTDLRTHLIDFARKASKTVQDEHLTDEAKAKSIDDMLLNYREVISEQEWGKLSTIKVSLQAVLAKKRSIDQARKFIAIDLLDCRPDEIGGAA